ncbi:MAG TPA: CDP-diacylglycerol--glycerol-3-phosphate 3-phosphatidyltransferase [Pirellulaceae bacterium]|nr:CDP-diacylglycerol--glycerol-3-phosphate 3-phosphatidyltransferase [Planctomycetales bacterium]MCB9939330.1 CDP-diacylglycerol--glycerol-3-phosphate 3-phosphatidyltransferase [Planctomycetaceae bacterium]HRX79051.1 CDP-diacylglycerol--glycerol-3-phosphate 3-phosphatidyltransferase [Pirellulaceae bacterium]
MAEPNEKKPTNDVFNVPNQLTAARFILAIVVFVLIPLQIYLAALIVFLIAASTDWIDGYYARKYGQVTKFGRMFDPFVDKIIICGTFIFLAGEQDSGIAAWMAVVVVGRELLVTALRSSIEQSGGDFSASFAGKLKMLFQCAAVVASLLLLWLGKDGPSWLPMTLFVLAWVAVLSTIQSGLDYIYAAVKYFRLES